MLKKVFNWSEVHLSEVTSYKIHTLIAFLTDFFSGPIAKFNNLPEEPIFTMHHHIPDNWLIEPVQSVYDLDNIKLATVEGSGVHSEFELEHLLLEGKNLF